MSVSTPGAKLKSEAVSPDTEVYKAWLHVLILGLILCFVSSQALCCSLGPLWNSIFGSGQVSYLSIDRDRERIRKWGASVHAFKTLNTPLCQILVEIRSIEEHGYNDCKLMCVLHNDFKIQSGKWLSRGKHRWGVVKAHRRKSRKGKEPTIGAFKK